MAALHQGLRVCWWFNPHLGWFFIIKSQSAVLFRSLQVSGFDVTLHLIHLCPSVCDPRWSNWDEYEHGWSVRCRLFSSWKIGRQKSDSDYVWFINCNQEEILVDGATTILKNDGVRQWGWDYPIYEMENKSHVWNHQPAMLLLASSDIAMENHQITGKGILWEGQFPHPCHLI